MVSLFVFLASLLVVSEAALLGATRASPEEPSEGSLPIILAQQAVAQLRDSDSLAFNTTVWPLRPQDPMAPRVVKEFVEWSTLGFIKVAKTEVQEASFAKVRGHGLGPMFGGRPFEVTAPAGGVEIKMVIDPRLGHDETASGLWTHSVGFQFKSPIPFVEVAKTLLGDVADEVQTSKTVSVVPHDAVRFEDGDLVGHILVWRKVGRAEDEKTLVFIDVRGAQRPSGVRHFGRFSARHVDEAVAGSEVERA